MLMAAALAVAATASGATLTVTTTNDSGPGSLRQAMLDANASPGSNTIAFNILPGGHQVITPATDLPTLNVLSTGTIVTIDGTTQPGYVNAPLIEISGLQSTIRARGNTDPYSFNPTGSMSVKALVVGAIAYNGSLTGSASTVQRCYIGTDHTGLVRQPYGGTVSISTSSVQVGGANPADGNLLAGIVVSSFGPAFMGMANASLVAQNNLIGTDVTGTNVLANASGISVSLNGMAPCSILNNVIAGSAQAGVTLTAGNSLIAGNAIGTDRNGLRHLGNLGSGITIWNNGYIIPGFPQHQVLTNVIYFNAGPGVQVAQGSQTQVSSNSIYANGGIGVDNGVNNLQSVPAIDSAVLSGGYTVVSGSFQGAANAWHTLEFFYVPDLDPTDNGEGKAILGSARVMTDTGGNVLFNVSFPNLVPTGYYVTATATDTNGSTSQFSLPVLVASGPVLPTLSFAATNISLADGVSGTTNAVFTLTLSAASAQAASVNYHTADGSATAGVDYQATNGTLVFAPGQRTNTLLVPVIASPLYKTNQTFQLLLDNPTNAILLTPAATATILDDAAAPVASINDVAVLVAANGQSNVTFTLSLSAAAAVPVIVQVEAISGTAQAYWQKGPLPYSFAPGVTTQAVNVTFLAGYQGPEAFTVQLSSPVNATLGKATGTCAIDIFNTVPLSIADASVVARTNTTTNLLFVVSLAATNGSPITVNYVTSNRSAVAGVDYQAASGQLSFLAGETTKTIPVVVYSNAIYRTNLTFQMTLTNANTPIAQSQAIGTIISSAPLNTGYPTLAVQTVPGSKVALSWATNFPGYSIYVSVDPTVPSGWQLLSASPPVAAGRYSVTNSAAVQKKFYRLKK